MPTVVGYTYDADTWCVDCTVWRFPADGDGDADENGVSLSAKDGEGNAVHPMFDSDEWDSTPACGACWSEIPVANVREEAGI